MAPSLSPVRPATRVTFQEHPDSEDYAPAPNENQRKDEWSLWWQGNGALYVNGCGGRTPG